MAAQTPGNRNSYVYVGLAGETAPGRRVNSGLYRMADGDDEWTLLENGLPQAPAIRALTIHPENPDTVYAGTQDGPYVSTDHGDHWEKINAPGHGLPVWSIMFDPRDSDVLYAGYESCQICRSGDGGETWSQLPVSVRFPDVTLGPGSNPAKRVLMMAGSLSNPGEMYAAIEVGGLIRTLATAATTGKTLATANMSTTTRWTCTVSWRALSVRGRCSASAGPGCSAARTGVSIGLTSTWVR